MLNWITKLIGSSSKELPEGIDTLWLKSTEKYLEPIDSLPNGEGRSGLAKDILSFILYDNPRGILAELTKKPGIWRHFFIYGFQESRKPLSYAGFVSLPASMALRWAHVLDACMKSQVSSLYIQFPGGMRWPEALIAHIANVRLNTWPIQTSHVTDVPLTYIEQLLIEGGLQASSLISAAFSLPAKRTYGIENRLLIIKAFSDYPDAVHRHAETIRQLLLPPEVPQRLHVIKMLEGVRAETLAFFTSELSELGVSTSKQVRVAAEPFIRNCGSSIFENLKGIAIKGKPDQRVNALRLIWELARQENDKHLRNFARDTAKADKAPSAQALIQEWDSIGSIAENNATQYEYEIPSIDWSSSMSPGLSKLLEIMWKEITISVEKMNKQSKEHHEKMLAQGHKFQLHIDPGFPDKLHKMLYEYIDSNNPAISEEPKLEQRGWSHTSQAVQKLAADPLVSITTLSKILRFFGMLVDRNETLSHPATSAINIMHSTTKKTNLLELQKILDDMGYAGSTIVLNSYCKTWGFGFAKDWDKRFVWPFFAHNQDLLGKALSSPQAQSYFFDRSALFHAVSTLPTPPLQIANILFELALGSGKTDRLLSQMALSNHPEKESRIVSALSDGKVETRTVAAQWLAKLKYIPAIPNLEKAALKEKHDVAKGAMLDALQSLGQPVEKYLDRESLLSEAVSSISKGIPKDLDWFPLNSLPTVRWADSGNSVSPEILRWFIVQAVKQKNPEPNAVLRKYCSMFHPRDREAFGQFILENWIREDVHPIAPDEAAKRAAKQAQQMHAMMHQYPQYYKDDPKYGLSVKELEAAFLPGFLRQPAGSQIGTKGLLAVAGACASERAAAPVARYLKEYYGTRAAQGKALISMLAWIDHPTATQLMLSIGNRFRTKSFQAEAIKQAEALADRKGWTLSELSDRTIPSAGFDENGILELSYGPRVFTAKLLPDFKIELFNPDGKKIASLPDPRQDDDQEIAKDSKKAFSTSKKEIKSIITLQTDRLYEALCTERDWSFEDWNLYLNQHPVVRRLIQGLVWVQMNGNEVQQTFRPLDDGTLTDSDDNEVKLMNDARVRIAHDSILSTDVVKRWQQHLIDYKVSPLFQQLGKGTYILPDEKKSADCINDYEGYLIEAFALRGRSLKLGYTRGAAEDGGWFYVYEKRFPTLGLNAVIEFTGNSLPEENRTVALKSLSFTNSNNTDWQRPIIPLSKIPRILLSECYNDLRLIASEGSGFDPDWQKKTEY